MILNLNNINNINSKIEVPRYNISKINPGFLHFGVGNFHRAHQAVYVHELLQKGFKDLAIIGVSLRSRYIKEKLENQDYLYSVCQISERIEKIQIINSIKNIIYAPEEPDRIINYISDQNIKYITITVTENGYKYNPETSSLLKDKDLKNDLKENSNPKTLIGFIARGLYKRSKLTDAPIIIISCDNLSNNGNILKKLIIEFFSLVYPNSINWINNNVKFPNTMVDGIVPRTNIENLKKIEKKISLNDNASIIHEPYSQWCIENSNFDKDIFFVNSKIKLVENIRLYEDIKLRFLNASHSAIAYIGLLLGYKYVYEVLQNEECYKFILNFMHKDVSTIIHTPLNFNKDSYINLTLDRFKNPYLKDNLSRISMDGSYKIKLRFLDSFKERLKNNSCDYIIFIIACWLKFLHGRNELNKRIDIIDPNLKYLNNIINSSKGNTDILIENFVNYKFVFEINNKDKLFLKKNLKDHYTIINKIGVMNSIKKINK